MELIKICFILSSIAVINAVTTEIKRSKRAVEIEVVPLLSKEFFTFKNPSIDRNNEEEFNKYHMFIEKLYRNDKTKDVDLEVIKRSYDSKKTRQKRSADISIEPSLVYQSQKYEYPQIQYQETQDIFYNRQPRINQKNSEQVSAYDSFLSTLYKADKNKDTSYEVRKRLSKRDIATEPAVSETDRQGRVLTFRPLFVYRHQELKKQQYWKKRRHEEEVQAAALKPSSTKPDVAHPPKKYYPTYYSPSFKGSDYGLYESYDPYHAPYQYALNTKPVDKKYYFPIAK